MKKLTIGSFRRMGIAGSFGHLFTAKLDNGHTVCLESCLEGYDVAIYDENEQLIGEKECTHIEGMMDAQIASGFSMLSGEALLKAIEIANKMMEKYEK